MWFRRPAPPVFVAAALAVAACAEAPSAPEGPAPETAAAPAAGASGAAPPRTAESFDSTTPEERTAARAGTDGALLGTTVASLGPPSEEGFWLRTGLVTAETPGRVSVPGGSASARVTLHPSGAEPGAGSQLSLAAYRLLELPLTDLPELDVYANR